MSQFIEYFKNKRNLVNLLFLVILIVGLPIGIQLARNQQILKSKAAGEPVTFLQGGCVVKRGDKLVATCPEVTIQLLSPLGPNATASASPSPSAGASCDPKEKSESVITSTWERLEANECKKGEQKVKYRCKYKEDNKDKKKEVTLKLSCPSVSPLPSGTPSHPPAILCNPDETNLATIKSPGSGWGSGELKGGCKNKVQKVEYICNYQENNKVKTQKRTFEESCTTSDSSGVGIFQRFLGLIPFEIDLTPEDVYAGHLGHEADFCEGDGVSLSHEDAEGNHTFIKDCSEEGKVCKDGACVEQGGSDGGGSANCDYNETFTGSFKTCSDGGVRKCRGQMKDGSCQFAPGITDPNACEIVSCSGSGGSNPNNCKPAPGAYTGVCGNEDTAKSACGSTNPTHSYRIFKNNSCAWESCRDEGVNSKCGNTSSCNPAPGTYHVCGNEDTAKSACGTTNSTHKYRIFKNNSCAWESCRDEGVSSDCSSSSGGSSSGSGSSGSGSGSGSGSSGSGSSGSGSSRSGESGRTPTPSPSVTQQSSTVSYKLAENPTDLEAAQYLPYDAHPKTINYTFSTSTPGIKTLFVEFLSSTGEKRPIPAAIELVAPDPVINTANCSLSSFGAGVTIDLNGEKFGTQKGNILLKGDFENILGKITNWNDNNVSATVDLPEDVDVEGQEIGFILNRKDGSSFEGACAVGEFSSLALGAKLFCRAPSTNIQEGIEVMILEYSPNAEVQEEVVTIDRNGLVRGLETKFVEGKTYVVSVKAPRSLRRNSKPFVAKNGTLQLVFNRNLENDINSNKLPIGDIFPLEGGDGVINSQDAREMFLEWSGVSPRASTSNKLGDFNLDGKVNSVDWACMRYDFNEAEDPPLESLPDSYFRTATQTTTETSTTTQTSSPSPTPSPSPTVIPGPTITVENSAFTPVSQTVKKGTPLTWVNRDLLAHSIVLDSTNSPISPILATDNSFTYTFSQAGTYTYHCGIHPEMKGTIIVTE